jgi:putative transposase
LVRKARGDQGIHRRVPPELQRLIECLALQTPPPTAAFVHRRVCEVARQRAWPLPSYRTVAAIMQALDPGLVTLAHDGPKVYRETFDLLHRREASRPNEIWQADHTLLDLWLVNEHGQPARPWLTIILDDYSRAISGYVVSFQAPSALHTALALRQAIWRKADPRWHICGIPEQFYTDHGSDFTSRHLEQVSADLKMELIFSHPGAPRGRGKIERFFETVNQLFLCGFPGYSPAGSAPAAPALTLAQLDAQFHTFVVETYHPRLHSEIGTSPQVRWEAGGFAPRLPAALEHLDLLLLTVAKARRVHQDGIHFQGYRYIDLTLAAYVGEDVTIRYDPRDMAEIRVYHQDTFLCRAVCQELAGQTISLKEILQTRNRRRRQLREQLEDRAAAVDLLLEDHQPAPPPAPSDAEPATPRLKRYFNE